MNSVNPKDRAAAVGKTKPEAPRGPRPSLRPGHLASHRALDGHPPSEKSNNWPDQNKGAHPSLHRQKRLPPALDADKKETGYP